LPAALAAASRRERKIVRIVGNGGFDSDPGDAADNAPYLVGLRTSTRFPTSRCPTAASFGAQDVTVMIDAGRGLQDAEGQPERRTTPQGLVSRSGGAIQVLGTPSSRSSSLPMRTIRSAAIATALGGRPRRRLRRPRVP
jgi:hypothetical protein